MVKKVKKQIKDNLNKSLLKTTIKLIKISIQMMSLN